MLNGRYTSAFISIAIHTLLFLLIYQQKLSIPKQTFNDAPKIAIKSFLYKAPKKLAKEIDEKVNVIDSKPQKEDTGVISKIEPKIVKEVLEVKPMPEQEVSDKIEVSSVTKSIVKPPSKKKVFSAIKQLDQLRNNINQNIIAKELSELQAIRSPSVMDGDPLPVPHSMKQLSNDQIKSNSTTRISTDISITKNDNGTCSIERDLSNVGIEGVKSVEFFACGESKFDKSFREHMKRVQKKLGH